MELIEICSYIKKMLDESNIDFKDIDNDDILTACVNYEGKINRYSYIIALKLICEYANSKVDA